MIETADRTLLRLMTWLSPTFPVGAFSYSHGIERAIEQGVILDRASLEAWLGELLARGSVWNDAVLLAESWRQAQSGEAGDVSELAEAMAGSRERHMETMLQGGAFRRALDSGSYGTLSSLPEGVPYPVAVAAAAAASDIALELALVAYLHSFVSSLAQAAVRLVPLGQSDGVAVMAALEKTVLATARRAAVSTLDDLGSAAFISEIMAMRHETQYSRVFRS